MVYKNRLMPIAYIIYLIKIELLERLWWVRFNKLALYLWYICLECVNQLCHPWVYFILFMWSSLMASSLKKLIEMLDDTKID
jgi:hypothetical protein